MELSRKHVGFWSGLAAVAAAAVVACTACCIPLIVPMLAWLGVAGLALMGTYGLLAAAFGAAAIGLIILIRRRHRTRHGTACGVAPKCQTGCGSQGCVAGSTELAADMPAPIACTLSAADSKERARWLSELKGRALIRHRMDGLSVHLSYLLVAATDVEQMVRQERACCSFLHFDLRRTATTMELTVTASADGAADARLLFAHLVSD